MRAVKFLCAGLFFVMMSISSVGQAHVLDGVKEWNGHYYKIIQMKMTWSNAKTFCESVGGHLATAETQDENEILKQIFSTVGLEPEEIIKIFGVGFQEK